LAGNRSFKDYVDGRFYKVSLFCVASEDNELMERIRSRRPLRNLLLGFSDYEYYQLLSDYFKSKADESMGELRHYRSQRAQLEAYRISFNRSLRRLESLESERALLPKLSLEQVFRNEKEESEHVCLRDAYAALLSKVRGIEGECKRLEHTIKVSSARRERLWDSLEHFREAHPEHDSELSEMYVSLEETRISLELLLSEMRSLQASLEDTDRAISRHTEFGVGECFACGQSMSVGMVRSRQKSLELLEEELSKKILDCRRSERVQEEAIDKFRNQVKKNIVDRAGEIGMLDKRLSKARSLLKSGRQELKNSLPEVDDLAEKLRIMESGLDSDVREIIERRRELDREIGRVDQKMMTIRSQIEDIGSIEHELTELEERFDFLSKFSRYMSLKAMEIKGIVCKMFNKYIAEVYGLLEFDDSFDRIYMDEDFSLKIIRQFQGRRRADSVDTLSGGERETIALVLMLAGRKAYVPDFPFFIADETSFYDQTRFRRVVEYISQNVPCTVITRLVPKEGDSRIFIEHIL